MLGAPCSASFGNGLTAVDAVALLMDSARISADESATAGFRRKVLHPSLQEWLGDLRPFIVCAVALGAIAIKRHAMRTGSDRARLWWLGLVPANWNNLVVVSRHWSST
jgi:hypothetical protein